VHSVTDRRTDG